MTTVAALSARATGKSADPDYQKTTVYLSKQLHRNVKIACLRRPPPILSSTLVESPIIRKGRSDVKQRFTEAQIIGFLREAETGLPVKDLRRRRERALTCPRDRGNLTSTQSAS